MPLLVDTGILFALADAGDAWHERARTYVESNGEMLLAPVTVLPEIAYLLRERIGIDAEHALARALASGELAVEPLDRRDWPRVEQLMKRYSFLGFVDATVIAVAERLKLKTIATTDRRHFGAVKPAHVEKLQLVP
jgi:predicted nucleic acid-binding protein